MRRKTRLGGVRAKLLAVKERPATVSPAYTAAVETLDSESPESFEPEAAAVVDFAIERASDAYAVPEPAAVEDFAVESLTDEVAPETGTIGDLGIESADYDAPAPEPTAQPDDAEAAAKTPVDEEPSPAGASFTDADWEDEFYALMAEQAAPQACPECGRTGFYGPRALDGKPKFRGCRFCGFFQEVGREPSRLQPVAHDCQSWPEAAGAPYIWWISSDEKWYTCNYCAKRVAVTGANTFMKGAAVRAPADDPNHPWRKVPQNASYDTYYRLWEKWPSTKGRVFL